MAVGLSSGRRKFWGWGLEGEGLSRSELERLGDTFARRFGLEGVRIRGSASASRNSICARHAFRHPRRSRLFSVLDPYDRAAHTYGRSFRDLVRAFRRDYAHAPDLVAFPRDEEDVVSVLEWCSDAAAAAIPFGGGSSVAGGVEPDVGDGYRGTVSVDLRNLAGVLEVDSVSAPRGSRPGRSGRPSKRS